jgi:HAD superfamily hydrolase (TIGR01549 family)
MAIKAVLFDLGETLFTYGRADINALLRQAARLTYDYLRRNPSSTDKLPGFRRYYHRYIFAIKIRYFWSYVTNREFNAQTILYQQLRRMGLTVSPSQLEELSWLWYKPAGDLVALEPKLHQHLQRLQDMSLQLAIVSNTFSPPTVLDRHLKQFDLLRFFPVRQYSSEIVYRKPHPRIFQITLQKLGVTAAQAVMVGDRLREDIKGAARLGIRPILKRAYTNESKHIDGNIPIIDTIAELPDLISRWQGHSHEY